MASISASSMGRKRSAVAPQDGHTSGGASPSWIQPHDLHRNIGCHFLSESNSLGERISRLTSRVEYTRDTKPRSLATRPRIGYRVSNDDAQIAPVRRR